MPEGQLRIIASSDPRCGMIVVIANAVRNRQLVQRLVLHIRGFPLLGIAAVKSLSKSCVALAALLLLGCRVRSYQTPCRSVWRSFDSSELDKILSFDYIENALYHLN